MKNVDLIENDSKRFPKTNGWAYALFTYDPASQTFKPSDLSATGHECGWACHRITKATDYIFTKYPVR